MENKTRKLTECAIMVALAVVLSFVKIYEAPYGGSVTLGSMVPLVLICVRIRDIRWGMLACFAYSLVQMMFGFVAPPTPTLGYFALVVLLDYVIAFMAISIANPISKCFKNKAVGTAVGSVAAVAARFVCHFLSGCLIWNIYAGELPVWLYSVLYNGGYLLPELAITTVLSAAIMLVLDRKKA